MVSVIWAMISLSFGFMCYLLVAAAGGMAPVDVQTRIGRFYYSLAMKSFGQVAIVRRLLGSYELLPIGVDDNHKVAEVTLSSGVISDDKKLPFKDPDNRLKRLFAKPLALVVEDIPAAVDAELSEFGYWAREHDISRGILRADGGTKKIDPYFRMSDGLRIVDPLDSLALVPKAIQPENIETAKQLTKKRFEKYAGRFGVVETAGLILGFAVGAGGVAAMQYIRERVLPGGGGGAPGLPDVGSFGLGGTIMVPMDWLVQLAVIIV